MNTVAKVLVVALLLFALAAGGSWFMQQKLHGPGETATATPEPREKPVNKTPVSEAKSSKPAVRPPYAPEADKVSKMAATLQQQLEAVKVREQDLATRQKALEAIYHDLRTEQKSVDDIRKLVAEELKLLHERMGGLENKASENQQQLKNLTKKADEINSTVLEVQKVETGRLKQLGGVYDTMEPDAAAQIMQDMVEKGKLDTAVKILGSMKERQMARVLAAFTEPSLAVQMLDRLKGLKTPTTKTP